MLTDNFSFQFGDDGVIFNPDSSVPPFYDIHEVEGLDNAPFRVSTKETEGRAGGTVEAEFEGIRTITVKGELIGNSDPIEPLLDECKRNFAPTLEPKPFYFRTDVGQDRLVWCKSLGFRYNWDLVRRLNCTRFAFQLSAPDPTIYSALEFSTPGTVGTAPTTGRGYNKGYPFGYGTPFSGGTGTVVNEGNKPTPGILTIWGPVTHPRYLNELTGQSIDFIIDLAASEYLVVDLLHRTVRLNGETNRRSAVSNEGWFLHQSGSTPVRVIASSGSGLYEVRYRYAYW